MTSCSAVPKLEDDECKEYVKQKQNRSLLAKYDIPITHLDYGYIAGCDNAREMEKIVMILRSGEEGCYPDLLKKAEERLYVLKPESKVLRVDTPVLHRSSLDPNSREELLNGISEWCGDIRGVETELQTADTKPAVAMKARHGLPDIRNSTTFMTDSGEKRTDRSKRIAACDYQAWDKYDPDTEILKMDLQEEKNREAAARERTCAEREIINKHNAEDVIEGLSVGEKRLLADRQRLLGNESYRVGDYKVALVHYTNSLQLTPTSSAYNNRAAANLKLKRYEDASRDCDEALLMEEDNVKALLRKGEVLQGLGNRAKAMEFYEHVIKIDPNNTVAQKGAYECKAFIQPTSKTVRMRIDDDDNLKPSPKIVELVNYGITYPEEKENRRKIIANSAPAKPRNRTCLVPIPSTSNFVGPSVMEITIPEDVPVSKVDASLVQNPKKNNYIRNIETDTVKAEDSEPKIIYEQHENQTEERDQITIPASETFAQNPESIEGGIEEKDIERSKKQSELKVFEDAFDDNGNNETKIDPRRSESPRTNKQRVPLQDKDVRAQRKKDKKRAPQRSNNAPPGGMPFQFRQHDIGSSGDTSIEVAAKYKKAAGGKPPLWPKETEELENPEDRALEERIRQNYTVIEVNIDMNQFKGNENFLNLFRDPNAEPEPEPQPETRTETVTPFEFLKSWEAIKNDRDYVLRAKLLRQIDPDSLSMSNKLDANMFSGILECLKRHFITSNDRENAVYLANFLDAMYELPRFSVVAMFKDQTDEDNLRAILQCIDKSDIILKSDIKKYIN